ncbi:MAG: hypothetical protein HN348_34845 [Proteobacteria bacterium]|nr:hypothetical protein [Pseudomonadota bacterium]
MTPEGNPEFCRREFIRLALVASAAFAVACDKTVDFVGCTDVEDTGALNPCLPSPDDEWLEPSNADVGLPHLGGAPDTEEGWAIAAFVDTIMPGAHRDPTGAPGGIDAGAPGMFFDPELPAYEFVPLLVGFLDGVAANKFPGETFATIATDERDEVVETAVAALDLMELAIQLVKLATFSSEGSTCHLGYPGPNAGYFDDPHFTFGEAMATEVTSDGNYP